MNSALTSATWRSTCTGCGWPFTEWGWDQRHDIDEHDAEPHNLEAGSYHDWCCALPACATSSQGSIA